MSSLREAIKSLSGNKRKFFLLRIADLDPKSALRLVGVTTGTYNSWLQHQDFVELYRQRNAFNAENKQEAIQLLRRDNQLEAVLLEGKIVKKMKDELDSGEYDLIRSNLAREVYSSLISGLEAQPQGQVLSWEQRIQNIFMGGGTSPQVVDRTSPQQITDGGVIDGIVIADSPEAKQVETIEES